MGALVCPSGRQEGQGLGNRGGGVCAHPHSQCENAASAEPMREEGPAGIDCDGDVALLVVTWGEGRDSESLTREQWSKASWPKAARLAEVQQALGSSACQLSGSWDPPRNLADNQ